MEAFAFYLVKSVIWLSGFALVYLLFLRNERFFLLNRFYLLAGIIASVFFPFISIHYTVILPVTENIITGNIAVTPIVNTKTSALLNFSFLMTIFYMSGALFVAYKVFKQSRTVIKVIKKAEFTALQSVKLIRTPEYTTSFSFFSYVFVNPSVTDIETKEIVNHEMAHIRQWHWFDLVLVELLCLLQWFNPVVWIYIRFIRQNHEYLADEVALQCTSDPAIYRAALLNQIVGAPVIILANSFKSSINKKRFIMMKNKISSPYRKLKLLLVLPVITVVLYSFAKPEYKYISADESNSPASLSSQTTKEVKGTIVNPSGLPLTGATVVLRGTTSGVTSDTKGFFRLMDVPEDGVLIVSYVGFKTKSLKPVFTADMKIKMENDTVTLNSIGVPPPPPPPPPSKKSNEIPTPPTPSLSATTPAMTPAAVLPFPQTNWSLNRLGSYGNNPLIIVNGSVKDIEGSSIDPNTIESITVLRDDASKALYGEKAKDGVIKITLKPGAVYSDMTTPKVTSYDAVKVTGYKIDTSKLSVVRIRNTSGGSMSDALVVIDGVPGEYGRLEEINPNEISSISVWKGERATDMYGEKAKGGVILITKKTGTYPKLNALPEVKINGDENKEDKYVVIEEMPAFPGGEKAILSYIYSNIRVIKGREKEPATEPINVVFTVDSKGKVRDAKVLKKKYPAWEKEAVRVIGSMPNWKPGSQNGKPIDVIMQLPIDFSKVKK